MPSKKKKYNARFPAGRIKKIMQTDDEVGKVAQAVPVIISRTLELFVESLLTKAQEITNAKNAKTLSPSHMKQCILSESRFDFLKELVASVSDVVTCDYEDGHFPSVMSPTLSCNNSNDDVSSSSNRRSEKQSTVPATGKDHPATSTTFNANFYKESANASMTGSTSNNILNSDKVSTLGSGDQNDEDDDDDDDDDDEIDEENDTT